VSDPFEEHRALLFGVAYRMLGTVTDAEDAVQETWLRWSAAPRDDVADPRAYLIRIAGRAALDQLRRVAARREAYVGPWLPEPVLAGPDVADEVALADSVSLALLVVLETLSPLERAVFVLREAFGLPHAEIAAALGRDEPAVRQLARRARAHVDARRPRYPADRCTSREVTERFLDAAAGGDLAALLDVLAPDVRLVADGGGKAPGPRRPLVGADRVARLFAHTAADIPAGTRIAYADVNGGPAALALLGRDTYAVFVLDVDPRTRRVDAIYLVANPDKLTGVRRR
jgi:RNA polymerase sigma-70 factor (ECF subfamily)